MTSRSSHSRRRFIRGAAGTALSAGLASCGFTPTPFDPDRSLGLRKIARDPKRTITVDPHCHIFNGRDVDITGYALALTRDYTGLAGYALLRGFVHGYLNGLACAAPSLDDEMSRLDDVLAKVGRYRPGDGHRQKVLHEELARWMGKPKATPELEARCRASFDNIVIHPSRTRGSILARDMIAKFHTEWNDEDTKDLDRYLSSGHVSDEVKKAFFKVQRESAWLLVHFVNYRTLNAYEMWRGYNDNPVANPDGATQNIDLFTPSLPDMNAWLDGEPDDIESSDSFRAREHQLRGYGNTSTVPSKMVRNMNLMEKIAVLFHGDILPIIGYCPAFAAACSHRRYAYTHPLDMLARAIKDQGCLGVKLYPPMGFRAWGNAALDAGGGSFYNEKHLGLTDRAGKRVPLGGAMDDELGKLYRFAVDHDLSLMSHTCPTHGSRLGYAKRAAPEFWERAITELQLPSLRLNLAHLGGWQQDGFFDRLTGGSTQNRWGEDVARMVTNHSHVYADFGDITEVAKKGWPDEFTKAWRNWEQKAASGADGFGPMKPSRKFMYGSDYYVSAQVDLFHEDDHLFMRDDNRRVVRTYAPRWADALRRMGAPEADIMGHNALRYLGLNTAKGLQRVESFFHKHSIEPAPTSWWRKLKASPHLLG